MIFGGDIVECLRVSGWSGETKAVMAHETKIATHCKDAKEH